MKPTRRRLLKTLSVLPFLPVSGRPTPAPEPQPAPAVDPVSHAEQARAIEELTRRLDDVLRNRGDVFARDFRSVRGSYPIWSTGSTAHLLPLRVVVDEGGDGSV